MPSRLLGFLCLTLAVLPAAANIAPPAEPSSRCAAITPTHDKGVERSATALLGANKTHQTDAAGRTTKWAYDKAGRPLSRTLPNGERETWQYDAAGNLTRHSAFDGQTTRYAYDSNDRRTLTLFPDGSKVAVTYSASVCVQPPHIEVGEAGQ